MLAPVAILHALEADVEAKREEMDGAALYFNDASEKMLRLWESGAKEDALAFAPIVREKAHELVLSTEAWIDSMRRLKSAVGA
jgi:hypothetical protein